MSIPATQDAAKSAPATSDRRKRYYDDIAGLHLKPLWEALDDLVPATPEASPVAAARWRYEELRGPLMEAGELIGAEEAVRRVLVLENPGLPGSHGITRALYAGLQLVKPGEIAPCHRHAQSALRFVLEGEGAQTAINGEPVVMAPFDLVLTPQGVWHDHANAADEPMVWLDGLDIPLVRTLDCGFAEILDVKMHPKTRNAGDMGKRHGRYLQPTRIADDDAPFLCHYPYREWRESLKTRADTDAPDPWRGHEAMFANSATGGPVMTTISAFAQLIPAGQATRPRRASAASVIVVCEGTGRATLGHETFDLKSRDILVCPSWRPLSLKAETDLVLFRYSDQGVQEALGLWREALE